MEDFKLQETNGVMGIYALIDPNNGAVGYVGKSKDIAARYIQHIEQHGSDRKSIWIAELASMGVRPELKLLERCGIDLLDAREEYWLTFYLDSGEAFYNESKKLKCRPKISSSVVKRFQATFDSATYALIDAVAYVNGTTTTAALSAAVWQHIAEHHRDNFDLFKVMLKKRGVDFNAELSKRT